MAGVQQLLISPLITYAAPSWLDYASSVPPELTRQQIEQSGKGRYSVGVTAVVKVMLKAGTYHEDVGYGMAEHPKKGSAIENAKKVTPQCSRVGVVVPSNEPSL